MTILKHPPETRQQLYEAIRNSSKEAVILDGMIRYGFWPERGEVPQDPAEDIHREGEIRQELASLRNKLAKANNIEALVRAARKKRMQASRERQKQTKERRKQEREERARLWEETQKSQLIYLGEDVSSSLGKNESDVERLEAQGLPRFTDAFGLATALGISLRELRFLAYSRAVSKVHHYKRFALPKKTGGIRVISAPMKRLKRLQEWILTSILEKVEVDESAHGFRKEHSILTNAEPHVGSEVLVNVDLADFFPTVTYRRVWGCFRGLGYSPALSSLFALLCTEADVVELELDGVTWFVQQGERHLPQGSPASPALTNIICRKMDRRLGGLATQLGLQYTRYADDMTFSGDSSMDVGRLFHTLRTIVYQEGFVVHPEKTRVLRRGSRKEVTGIVVNEKLSVSRRELRRFRATLFQIEKDGLEGKTWGRKGSDLLASIEGYANFVAMVDAKKGASFVAQVQRIREKYA